MVIGGDPRGDGCTAPSHREGRSCLQGPSSCLSRALESRARRCEVTSSQPACPRLELEKPALLKSGHLEEVSVQSVRKSLKNCQRLPSLVSANPDASHDSKAQGCVIFRQFLARCLRILHSLQANTDGQEGTESGKSGAGWDGAFLPGGASLIISRRP